MLVLPDGSVWIFPWEKEKKDYTTITKPPMEEIKKYFYQFTPKEFCKSVVERDWYRVLKYTNFSGGFWDGNFEVDEVFSILCERFVTFYEGFTAYVMSWGEVYLFHDCGDGYDWGRSIERFPSVREFNKKFTL